MTSVSSVGTGRECGTSNQTSNEKEGVSAVRIVDFAKKVQTAGTDGGYRRRERRDKGKTEGVVMYE